MDKDPGAEVIGGTVNGSGSLRVRISRTGDETMLAGIMRLVQEAQTSRTRAQALADRAAFWLTLVAVGRGARDARRVDARPSASTILPWSAPSPRWWLPVHTPSAWPFRW